MLQKIYMYLFTCIIYIKITFLAKKLCSVSFAQAFMQVESVEIGPILCFYIFNFYWY